MNYIDLGKTGLKVSAVGFGGIPIIRLQADEAVRVLRHAFDRGITFYDTANMYRDSESKIGLALSHVRDKIIIATKTTQRNAAEFRQHLEGSLKAMKTDYIDLYQFPMESTQLCDECGVCIERCPYDLPIPDLLKKNYDLFEAHRSQMELK